jgi:hypothetical protein
VQGGVDYNLHLEVTSMNRPCQPEHAIFSF